LITTTLIVGTATEGKYSNQKEAPKASFALMFVITDPKRSQNGTGQKVPRHCACEKTGLRPSSRRI